MKVLPDTNVILDVLLNTSRSLHVPLIVTPEYLIEIERGP